MNRSHQLLCLLAIVAVTDGCASLSSGSATPAAERAPSTNLTGRWDFRVDLGTRTTPGELWLFVRGNQYTGTLTPQGTNTLPVRSLTIRGLNVAMTVDTPEGPVSFDGTVGDDGTTMKGIVTYHQGQRYPLEARRKAQTGG